jgi:nicotinamide mononucleotide transporter
MIFSKEVLVLLELLAILFSLGYTILLWKKKRMAWGSAVIGSLLFVIVFYVKYWYLESIISFIYAILGAIAFSQWRQSTDQKTKINPGESEYFGSTIFNQFLPHLFVWVCIACASLLTGFVLSKYTHQQLPYLDSFSFWFQCFATYLAMKQIRSNWIYFIVIDLLLGVLFFYQGEQYLPWLYLFYTALAYIGWLQWKEKLS